ncbi:MAG TPA: hypothetical protein VMM78_09470 [Thermomicrobiales bacterium]|nr:hypothetical protein [Thermomicrobiales bacterium]
MNDIRITEQDITSLSHKLAALVETLTPGEAAAFEVFEQEIATTIASRGSDVQAYTMTTTTATETAATTTTRAENWQTMLTTLTGTTTTTTG